MSDSGADFLPERRTGQNVSEYRLTRVEDEMKDQNRKLDTLDNKLDGLRQDLFERHPFVPSGVFAQYQASIEQRVTSLESTNTSNISNGLIKVGITVSIIGSILALIGTIVYHG